MTSNEIILICIILPTVFVLFFGWIILICVMQYKLQKALGTKYRIMYYTKRNIYKIEQAYYVTGYMIPTWPTLQWKTFKSFSNEDEAKSELNRLRTSTDREIFL